MPNDDKTVPKVVLLESEIEAAAARVAERALNDTWTGASGFFGDVFGGLVGDRVKQWRTRNLVDALVKTRDHLEKQGVSIENAKALPMGELYAIFEGASKTDDVDLRDMWSALLSNKMNPDKESFTDPSFPRLLGELSGLDAQILNYMIKFAESFQLHAQTWENALTGIDYMSMDEELRAKRAEQQRARSKAFKDEAEKLQKVITDRYSDEHISYSISNLSRLGLIDIPEKGPLGRTGLISVAIDHRTDKISMSTSGLEAELKDLRQRYRLGFSSDKTLPKLSEGSRLLSNTPMPGYALTDFAKRFLQACA